MGNDDDLKRIYALRLKDRRQLRPRKPQRPVDRLSNILRIFFKNTPGTAKKMEESHLLLSWPRIVGETVARVTTASAIRDGKLVVRVSDPLWRAELTFQKSKLLDRIGQEFPRMRIKDIFFTG